MKKGKKRQKRRKEKKKETYFLMSCLAFVPFSVVRDIFPKAYRYVATQKHFSSRAIRKKKSLLKT